MLLLDDDAELPTAPSEAEMSLAIQLGADGLRAMDAAIQRHARQRWLKVARVVADALEAGGFPLRDERCVQLHVRRLIRLVESGELEAAGNLRRPRWSEVRLPGQR